MALCDGHVTGLVNGGGKLESCSREENYRNHSTTFKRSAKRPMYVPVRGTTTKLLLIVLAVSQSGEPNVSQYTGTCGSAEKM